MRIIQILLAIAAVSLFDPVPVSAQWDAGSCRAEALPHTPDPIIEVSAARAGFLDDAPTEHGAIGAAARWYVNSLVSVGPEVTYMAGPGSDRDLFVTGNLTTDLRRTGPSTRVTPYLLIGAGLFRHSETFSGGTYASTEWGVTAGGGVRIAATARLWIAPEFRIGWEPHARVGVTIGYSFNR